MDSRLAEILRETYPSLHEGGGFYVDCGSGWFPILFDLFRDLVELNPYIYLTTVKEKYGTLRVYTDFGPDTVDERITQAEDLSSRTCEVCGEPGKRRNDGWIAVRCEKHINDDCLESETLVQNLLDKAKVQSV